MKIISSIIGIGGIVMIIIGISGGAKVSSATTTDNKIQALQNSGIVMTGIIALLIGGISFFNESE